MTLAAFFLTAAAAICVICIAGIAAALGWLGIASRSSADDPIAAQIDDDDRAQCDVEAIARDAGGL
jgi:hypothetical protein